MRQFPRLKDSSRITKRRDFCFDKLDKDPMDKNAFLAQELRSLREDLIVPDIAHLISRDTIKVEIKKSGEE